MKPPTLQSEVHRLIIRELRKAGFSVYGIDGAAPIARMLSYPISEYVRERIVQAEMEVMDVRAS